MKKEGIVSIISEKILAFLILLFFFFYEHIVYSIGSSVYYLLCFFAMGLSCFVAIKHIKKRSALPLFGAWILVLVILLYNNQIIAHNMYWISLLNFLSALFASFALIKSTVWIKAALKTAKAFSLLYVFATLLFFVIPDLGKFQYAFWGFYPNGTEQGIFVYKSGLASNYSANGIYISVALILIVAELFIKYQLHNKINAKQIVLLILTVSALLLTSKRGHLVFSALAIIIVFFLALRGRISNKIVKFVGIAIALIGIFMIASYFIPALNNTFERLFNAQTKDISMGRFNFWDYAMAAFNDNKLFGIGWFGFRFMNTNTAHSSGYFDAHCVYIQLLCETGIIGFVVTLYAILSNWVKGIIELRSIDAKENTERADTKVIAFSCLWQTFCLLYAFTGNMLYDRTFLIYILSIAMIWAVKYKRGSYKAKKISLSFANRNTIL
ncbi:MAG: O-antigen ligase family protein [Acutalibacteraceae bacterium]